MLLKVAQELQNQEVNQDLVKRIDPRLGQKDQVMVMHRLSVVLIVAKVKIGVQADLVVIAAKEELLQNAPIANVAKTEENQETDAHQLAHTANVQKAEAMTGAQADIAAKVAINAHQPAVEATIEEAALIEKKKTNANQHVQPENLVVLTW